MDIGYKSEGIVSIDEWAEGDETPEPGQPCQVLLEEVEDDFGLILLSKRKADRIREWEKVIEAHNEGDIITGGVVRKIKGGLLVNIGVNVFLPASYLTYSSTEPAVVSVSDDGIVRGIDKGNSVLLVSAKGLQAATVVRVGFPDRFTDQYLFALGMDVFPEAISLAVLYQLMQRGNMDPQVVVEAVRQLGINPEKPDPVAA